MERETRFYDRVLVDDGFSILSPIDLTFLVVPVRVL